VEITQAQGIIKNIYRKRFESSGRLDFSAIPYRFYHTLISLRVLYDEFRPEADAKMVNASIFAKLCCAVRAATYQVRICVVKVRHVA